MKKKIIFMVINMNIGGTEKALLNMISQMPKDQYDITILMLEKRGGFLDEIPGEVHVKSLIGYQDIKDLVDYPLRKVTVRFFKKGKLIKACNLFFLYLLTKVTKNKVPFYKYLLHLFPQLPDEYDIAVAYAGPMDLISYFVIHKIQAKKKMQWIHFDITKIGFNKRFASKVYKRFDKILVVSKEGKKKFFDVLPFFNEKVETFPNLVNSSRIKEMADEGIGFDDHFDGIRILTVGRLSKEKGQDLTIPVCARLKETGYNVRWYCIGEGKERGEYEQLIQKYEVQDDYILLGARTNPYPFMKECDLYVQSSRHEGYCITLNEAKCFQKLMVATHVNGAEEQIQNEKTGLLVGINEEEIYQAIKKLLSDDHLRKHFSRNLKKIGVDAVGIERMQNIFKAEEIGGA